MLHKSQNSSYECCWLMSRALGAVEQGALGIGDKVIVNGAWE